MLTRPSIFFILLSSPFVCFIAETRKELRNREAKVDTVQLLNRQRDKVIDPSRVTELSWRPRVFLYENFLSDKESDHLVSLVHGRKTKSLTSHESNKADKVKLSENFAFPLDTKDEIVAGIEEKISAWTFIPKDNGKPLQILHFENEKFPGSHNYFGNQSASYHGDTLMATVVLYLSNVSRGGQILFPESESKILLDCSKSLNALRPTKGHAVVFFNVHLNASPDRSSSHARCPVLEGEMWVAIKLLYLRPIREKEPSGLVDRACTDEDDNCPRWASLGECEKNPVFMIGTPDYYGTCRKSCNVCSLLMD